MAALVAALGFILGYPSGLAIAEYGQGLRGVVGSTAAIFVLVTLVAALAAGTTIAWVRIAWRVLGIPARGVALRLAHYGPRPDGRPSPSDCAIADASPHAEAFKIRQDPRQGGVEFRLRPESSNASPYRCRRTRLSGGGDPAPSRTAIAAIGSAPRRPSDCAIADASPHAEAFKIRQDPRQGGVERRQSVLRHHRAPRLLLHRRSAAHVAYAACFAFAPPRRRTKAVSGELTRASDPPDGASEIR